MAQRFVDVLVPVALDHPYSYRVPEAMVLAAGDLVSVPLGAREAIGVVCSSRSCAVSSIGLPVTRSHPAAWCCACACAWARTLDPNGKGSACDLPAAPPGA